jgi:tetratricopeptide (TPR) repeat protein
MSMKQTDHARLLPFLLCLILLATSCITFWPVLQNDFVNFDDPDYVTENAVVKNGLTWKGVQWAFTTSHAANWHPVTWLSHMLDVTLFGLKPMGHHLTSLLFHGVNSVLLLLLLRQMTGAVWRSMLVAGLFALHPLHVESVAWVAERKDVLSTFFGILTLMAYAAYAKARDESRGSRAGATPHPTLSPLSQDTSSGLRSPSPHPMRRREDAAERAKRFWYAMALGLFALGLMSKPMLVTWPFVMLLLDFWPLDRIRFDGKFIHANRSLLIEKFPFLLLAIICCTITYNAQSGASAVSELSLPIRLENAVVAHALYLFKLFVPIKLAVFYPIPAEFPLSNLLLSVMSVLIISALSLGSWRKHPEWFVGWAFFLGTLFPVSGIAVQVGQQLMADRYTYVPAIGLFIIISWMLGAVIEQRPKLVPLITGACGLVLIGLTILTREQLAVWRNSTTLFEHALRVTQNNHVAHNNLAAGMFRAGREVEAGEHAAEALRLKPGYADAHVNYANELIRQGRRTEAREHLETAIRLKPSPGAKYNLGNMLMEDGDFAGAESIYQQVLATEPPFIEARYNLALCLVKLGQTDNAISELSAVIAAQPTNSGARLNLGSALAAQNRMEEAAAVFQQQVALTPDNTDARFNLANVLQQLERLPEAQEQFEAVLRSNPTDVAARQGLGLALAQNGQLNAAAAQLQQALLYSTNATLSYQLALVQLMQTDFTNAVVSLQQALALETNAPAVLNDLAWVQATTPDPHLRQPAEALRHALRACELTERKIARFLGSLDAAYAANGQFENAITTAREVIALAEKNGESEIVTLANARLILYQQGRPYIQVLPNQAEPADQPK